MRRKTLWKFLSFSFHCFSAPTTLSPNKSNIVEGNGMTRPWSTSTSIVDIKIYNRSRVRYRMGRDRTEQCARLELIQIFSFSHPFFFFFIIILNDEIVCWMKRSRNTPLWWEHRFFILFFILISGWIMTITEQQQQQEKRQQTIFVTASNLSYSRWFVLLFIFCCCCCCRCCWPSITTWSPVNTRIRIPILRMVGGGDHFLWLWPFGCAAKRIIFNLK